MSHRSDERSRGGRESGFTMTELMMVIAMFVPILYAVVSAPSMIGGSLLANRSEASVGIKCRMQSERLATLIRPRVHLVTARALGWHLGAAGRGDVVHVVALPGRARAADGDGQPAVQRLDARVRPRPG
jgi:prepilin-type N-terminal cleavage/methylation domain-containing protein